MKSRPIIFSAPMVRAIIYGRKTQTRRLVKPQPVIQGAVRCPYGVVGDELWVRETWVELLHTSPATDQPEPVCKGDRLIEHATMRETAGGKKAWHYDGKVIAYKATSDVEFCDGDGFSGDMANKDDMPRWLSPIHMPRWASRITLELTSVRCERLQDITENDAKAEGVDPYRNGMPDAIVRAVAGRSFRYTSGFANLWNSIHDEHKWHTNPWVWVLGFNLKEVKK